MDRFRPERIDPVRVAIVAALLVVAVFVWSMARDRVVTPLDEMITEDACTTHGDEIGRALLDYERSNKFGLFNRSEGYCYYGEGPNGETPITQTMAEVQPGALYRAGKWIGIIIQLGIVSIFLRLTIDPALDLYRYIRSSVI